MSAALSKPGAIHRIHFGDLIVEELRAAKLPFEPKQFEFWFAYKNGRNIGLNAAANQIRLKNGALTAPDIDALHETFISPLRLTGTPDAIVARIEARLRDAVSSLDNAIASARQQREALATEAAQLGQENALTLQDVLITIDRLRLASKEGQTRLLALAARMDSATREIGTIQEQLSNLRAEYQIDPTTTLPNRASFNTALAETLEASAESRQPVSVALCNLDYFTAFNENFGNHTGDEILRSIGMMAKAQMRPSDMVARYGGDEYGVILPQARAGEAVVHAEKFRQALTGHCFVTPATAHGRVTVSIGVAEAIKGDTPEFLLRRAINAMKIAKREGRNRVVEMSPDGPIWHPARPT
jgi:diguanylate cyclase